MKKFKCPFCDEISVEVSSMHQHIEEDHEDSIPKNTSVQEAYYSIRTGRTHGNCVMCKNETVWNDSTSKYHRFCGNKNCKDRYTEEFKKRMIGSYGKVTLLNDPDHQRKMLANRSISGEYKFADGKTKPYTGSYEKDFLRFLDVFMDFDSDDVFAPSPHTYYYELDGNRHFYIPDFYIASLNLEVEVKDGGDNPNMHHKIQAVDKKKEKEKDNVMVSQKDRSYIKVVNKEYSSFLEFLLRRKDEFRENGTSEKPIFILNETKRHTIEEVKEHAVLESVSMTSLHMEQQGSDIEYIIGTIMDLVKDIDLDKVGQTKDFNFVSYKNVLRCIKDEAKSESIPFTSSDSVYMPYGLYVEELYNTLNNFTDRFDEQSATSMRRSLEYVVSLARINTSEDVQSLVLRDLFSISLLMQTMVNKCECIDKKKLCVKIYEYCMSEAIPSIYSAMDSEYDFSMIRRLSKSCVVESTQSTYKVSDVVVHPVYVLLSHSGTLLSNAIQKVTKHPYSHSSISLNPELDAMYSFGRKYKSNPLIGTFVRENIREGLYEDIGENVTYSLYVTFVTTEELTSIQECLSQFENSNKKFKYNFIGLIRHKLGLETEREDAYFCSEFVNTVLTSTGRDFTGKHSSMTTPYDFAKSKDFKFVSKGKLINYDPKKIDTIVSKIVDKL